MSPSRPISGVATDALNRYEVRTQLTESWQFLPAGITFVSAQRSPAEIEIAAEVVREVSARLSKSLGYSVEDDLRSAVA